MTNLSSSWHQHPPSSEKRRGRRDSTRPQVRPHQVVTISFNHFPLAYSEKKIVHINHLYLSISSHTPGIIMLVQVEVATQMGTQHCRWPLPRTPAVKPKYLPHLALVMEGRTTTIPPPQQPMGDVASRVDPLCHPHPMRRKVSLRKISRMA